MQTPEQIAEAHAHRCLIESTYREAMTFGLGKLTVREKDFLGCVFRLASRVEFTGLSPKQAAWLSSIARKLEATKGKEWWQVLAERNRARRQHYRDSYSIACFGN